MAHDWAKYEWIILEVLVLGLLIAELISVRRSLKKDRAQQRQENTE